MKKKFLILSIFLLVITFFSAMHVLAVSISSAQIAITSSKTEYSPGDTIEFTISLKNLNADRGISGLGAVVEYDTNLLELKRNAEGCANWDNASISANANKFATTRNRDENENVYSQNNEDILKIQFVVKEVSNETTTKISLKNIEISNGSLYTIENADSNTITLKPKKTTPVVPEGPDNPSTGGSENNNPTQTPGTNNNANGNENQNPGGNNTNTKPIPNINTNTSGEDSNTKNEVIPQLGEKNEFLTNSILVCITMFAIIASVIGVKIVLLNKKITKNK